MAAGLSTLDADNDDNYEVQEERNRYIPNFRHHADYNTQTFSYYCCVRAKLAWCKREK